MNYRLSTQEEIKVIAKYLVNDIIGVCERIPAFKEFQTEDSLIDSYVGYTKDDFYSTLETPYGYKIVSVLSFKPAVNDSHDTFQSKYIIFPNNVVKDISSFEIISSKETPESVDENEQISIQIDVAERAVEETAQKSLSFLTHLLKESNDTKIIIEALKIITEEYSATVESRNSVYKKFEEK